MPFDPRSTRPSRSYHANPRDPAGVALFWALVVVASLGAWVFASSVGLFKPGSYAEPEQVRLVVPEASAD